MKTWFAGLRLKLLIMSVIPLFSLVVMGWLAQKNLTGLNASLTKANSVRAPLITYSGEMLLHAASIARWTVTSMWLWQDASARSAGVLKTKESLEDFESTLMAYLQMLRSEKAKKVFAPVEANWPQIKAQVEEILPLVEQGREDSVNLAEEKYIKNVRPLINSTIDIIHELNKERKVLMETELKQEVAETEFSLMLMKVGTGAAVSLTLVFMFFFSRSLISQLNTISQSISNSANTLASSSQELSASSTEVASSSTETASSIQETVASLEEINSLVKTTDNSSQDSKVLTQETQKQAEYSEKKLGELLDSLNEISASSSKVSAIIQVIEDISFQTNLLALNAAVEAARAGEQGKGFAVVAEAVRSLAQKSAGSAKEINDLIVESVSKTKVGVKVGQDCKELMVSMFDSLKKVAGKSEEIASATREQSAGMEQIAKAMNQLDQAIQQNTTASEQISTASNDVSSQAEGLQGMVNDLKTLIDGDQKAG
ncbi:MAG: methyl-accepting chemotaxis protein [Bdellovibrionales bacterium]